MYLFQIIILFSSLNFLASKNCSEFETCSQCISSSSRCAWCSDEEFQGPRCRSKEQMAVRCKSEENPLTKDPKIVNSTKSTVPSEVNIKARPGDYVKYKFDYKPSKDYPIDVYYLFDNSFTMKDYRKQLQNEAKNIHDKLSVSNNVQFGAGSFVEKLEPPLASEERGDKLNTFNNHLSLTQDIDKFKESINVSFSSNLEDPEAGLDALMQAMVCEEQIKWRPNAFKIIVFLTDAQYHSAGDGRSVGAFIPNDMKCHLIETPENPESRHMFNKTESLLYDYPSVSQISYIARKKNVHIFFTTTSAVKRDYEALAKAIYGATFIELEERNSTNSSYLADTIKEQYVNMSQNLLISTTEIPSHIELTFEPNCLQKNDECNIGFNEAISITTKVTVKSCPTDKYDSNLKISFGGFDTLKLNVETLCQCDCERSGDSKDVKGHCSINGTSHGFLQCGICKCHAGWYGEKCQCEGKSTAKEDLRKCRINESDKPCSDRGTCECGVCKCKVGFGGERCQYRTDDCPAPFSKVCSDHGVCKNNECKCNEGWSDADCSCSTDRSPCVGYNGKECLGNGECKCGECKCNSKYSGIYCEQCDDCVLKRCEELHSYVICIYGGIDKNFAVTNKPTCDNTYELTNNFDVKIKNRTEVDSWPGTRCEKMLKDGSTILYKYRDGNNFTEIQIQSEKKMPQETEIWIPIGSALGAILLIGILTLIAWKVLVDKMDEREYRKFRAEAERSGYNVMENPLYKPAAVSINNPAYNEKQD